MSKPAVLSPCVRACRLEGQVCRGCGRTRTEIASWSRMSDAGRAAVMTRLATGRGEAAETGNAPCS